jgi:hypothetical protein
MKNKDSNLRTINKFFNVHLIEQCNAIKSYYFIYLFLIFSFFQNIFYSQSVTTTLYPTSSNLNTGYVTSSGTKYSDNMQVSTSTSYGRGWAKFSLSSIPTSATINSVTIIFYTYGGTSSTNANTITGFTGDPLTMVGSTLYSAIGSGTSFNTSTWSIGTTTSPSLNSKSLSATTFVQQQLSSGYVNFGFVRGAANLHSIYGYSNTNYRVRLQINYTNNCYVSLNSASILPNNNSFSTGYVTSSGIKTSGNLLVSSSSTYGRGWAKFPLTSIPANAGISSVNLKFYTYDGTSSSAANSICCFTGNPETMNGSTLYNTIGSATVYNSSTWSMGTPTTPSLNTKVLSAETFIQSQLSVGYVNIGFMRPTNGTYLYSIYGANNSNYTVSLEINYTIPLTAAITANGPLTFCSGGSVSLTATSGSGLSYQWSKNGVNITGETSQTYIASTSGTYTVTITNNQNCSVTASVYVTVNSSPTSNISSSGSSTFCQGGSVTLLANTGTGLSYQWKKDGVIINGATSNSYSATTSGSYTVLVTNTSGCSSTSNSVNVTVNPSPNPIISGITSVCQGSSSVLSVNQITGESYQWKQNGINILGGTNSSYNVTSSGTYSLFVTNINGCSATSPSVSVVVYPLPTSTISTNNSTTFCEGGNANLNTDNTVGLSYQWYKNGTPINGANASNYSATTSGNYNVYFTNSIGCSNFSSNSIFVNVLPGPSLFISGDTSICGGESTVLIVSSDGSVTWNGNINQNSIQVSPNVSTSYSISSVGSNGCTVQDQVLVTVNYPSDTTIYTSSFGPFILNGQVYQASGIYTQNLQTVAGCDSTITINLNYITNSIEELSDIGISIYPNPSLDGIFYLKNENSIATEKLLLYSSSGQFIEELSYNEKIDLSSLMNGFYWIQFIVLDKSFFVKVLKL